MTANLADRLQLSISVQVVFVVIVHLDLAIHYGLRFKAVSRRSFIAAWRGLDLGLDDGLTSMTWVSVEKTSA